MIEEDEAVGMRCAGRRGWVGGRRDLPGCMI